MDPIKEYKKNGKTYYKFKVYTGINPKTGKKSQTTKSGFLTKTQAKKARLEIQQAVANGTYWNDLENNKDKTFKEVYDEFYSLKENELKEVTLLQYSRVERQLKGIHNIFISKLTTQDVLEAIKKAVSSSKARNVVLGIVNNVLTFALNNGYVTRNVASNIPKFLESEIQDNKEVKALNKEQITFLLEHAKEHHLMHYTAFLTLIMSGLRTGELRALTWEDFHDGCLFITKTVSKGFSDKNPITTPKTEASVRKVVLDDFTIKALEEYKQTTNYDLIFTLSGKVMSRDLLNDFLRRLNSKYPDEFPKVTCHTLRHTHASFLFQSGVNPKVIQKRLGHSDFNTTMNIYTHLFEDFEEDNMKNFFERVAKGVVKE